MSAFSACVSPGCPGPAMQAGCRAELCLSWDEGVGRRQRAAGMALTRSRNRKGLCKAQAMPGTEMTSCVDESTQRCREDRGRRHEAVTEERLGIRLPRRGTGSVCLSEGLMMLD